MGEVIKVEFSGRARGVAQPPAAPPVAAAVHVPRFWDACWELPARSGHGFASRGWSLKVHPAGPGRWPGTCRYFSGGEGHIEFRELPGEDDVSVSAWRAFREHVGNLVADAPVQKA